VNELSGTSAPNRVYWENWSDECQQRRAPSLRGAAWGVWQIPEAEVHALGDVSGEDVLELGCGAAQCPGGLLAFNVSSPFDLICWDDEADAASDRLRRSYFETMRFEESQGGVTFTLPYGEWIRLLRANGFAVEALIELRPPPDAASTYGRDVEWSRRWPGESLWVTRKAPLVGADPRSAGFAGAPSARRTRNGRNV